MKTCLSFAFKAVAAPLVRALRHASHARACARHLLGSWRLVTAMKLVPLANEAPADRLALFGLTNEIDATSGDGWAKIGYGEWPHESGLQRFTKAHAEEMVGYFKNTWNRIKRAVVGMPIYRGHPDLKAIANQYPDKGVYGQIADMEARDDGLYLRPVLSEAGAALVNERGLKFFSPHWLARQLGTENGKPVYGPALMVSIGLTDRPNIAGTSLVNSAPEISPMNKTLVIQLLAAMGRAVDANATDDQLNAALTGGVALANTLVARPEPTALANEQTARTTAETQLTAAKGKLTDAETALANERTAHAAVVKARNELLVDGAVKAGRITEAGKPVWLGRLERDFATESVALANETGTIKITPKTADVGNRKAGSPAADKFTALVNERVAKGEEYTAAWLAVKNTEEGKALHAAMAAATAS